MNKCYPNWSRKNLSFEDMQYLIKMWYLELEKEKTNFNNMANDLLHMDKRVQRNETKCQKIKQMCEEISAAQKVVDCQMNDIFCELHPLEETVCCLEMLTCCPDFVDCPKVILYAMVESAYIKVSNLKVQAEELSALLDTQHIMYKISTVLSLDTTILNGLVLKINQVESNLLQVTEQQDQIKN